MVAVGDLAWGTKHVIRNKRDCLNNVREEKNTKSYTLEMIPVKHLLTTMLSEPINSFKFFLWMVRPRVGLCLCKVYLVAMYRVFKEKNPKTTIPIKGR